LFILAGVNGDAFRILPLLPSFTANHGLPDTDWILADACQPRKALRYHLRLAREFGFARKKVFIAIFELPAPLGPRS
jgi:hypothetical protein